MSKMPTPFPGMDPYLERPDLWPNVHSSLIVALRDLRIDYTAEPEPPISAEDQTWMKDQLEKAKRQ